MSPWRQGSIEVDRLLEEGALQRLPGADLGAQTLMDRAELMLRSAAVLREADPVTAYVVAYDAAKHAGMALLAEQNLRVTGTHGHLVIEQVLLAQFGGVFSKFSRLRRRRNELDYPQPNEQLADADEAAKAHAAASSIIEDAQQLLRKGVLTEY